MSVRPGKGALLHFKGFFCRFLFQFMNHVLISSLVISLKVFLSSLLQADFYWYVYLKTIIEIILFIVLFCVFHLVVLVCSQNPSWKATHYLSSTGINVLVSIKSTDDIMVKLSPCLLPDAYVSRLQPLWPWIEIKRYNNKWINWTFARNCHHFFIHWSVNSSVLVS